MTQWWRSQVCPLVSTVKLLSHYYRCSNSSYPGEARLASYPLAFFLDFSGTSDMGFLSRKEAYLYSGYYELLICRHSGMACVNKGSHSFTCHPHVYPQVELTIPAFNHQMQSVVALWLVLISRSNEGMRLSWEAEFSLGGLVKYRGGLPGHPRICHRGWKLNPRQSRLSSRESNALTTRLSSHLCTFLSFNQQRQSNEGNTKHSPQPVAWPHPFFIHHLTSHGRRCCIYASFPMPVPKTGSCLLVALLPGTET